MIALSYLYVPADDPVRLAKARDRGAQALIVDLEDGVAPSMKEQARQTAKAFIEEHGGGPGPAIWVRINRDAHQDPDLAAVLACRPAGIAIPKVESPGELSDIMRNVHRLQPGLPVMPLIESARGVLAMTDIASVPGVTHLQVGEADLRADIGVDLGPDESELHLVRQQAVLACAAAALVPPIAPVNVDFRDLVAFERSTEGLARMGYLGRACIHPAQVPIVHQVFQPKPEALERARELCALADAHAAQGIGAFAGPDGRLVDEPVVRQARRLLQISALNGSTG
jgi:citrate lyase subunit beta/citryl-CoA lyase